ncbi:MAG TPA: ATP-binding protein [Nostocaceae cyanobacterium]|nr:ATP-binding protein [Nostocaceae cyanobacterium]
MFPPKRLNPKSIFTRLSKFSNNWSIAEKICYGYAVAIGIAAIGTSSGLVISKYYQKKAYEQLNFSYQQQSLLKNLDNAATGVRLHPQRLALVLEDSIWLEYEKNKFLDDINRLNQKLSELENLVNTYPHELAVSKQIFHDLIQDYRQTTKLYQLTVQEFWQKIEQNKSLKQKTNIEQLLINLQKNQDRNLNIKFERLSDELIIITGYADIERQNAKKSFNHAQQLQLKIILSSIILSATIAALLALYTVRLIAHPLETVTRIAKKVTQESDFQLRVNINSKDEVGILANSLNQLVEWVKDYTDELELARQTLEQKVEERTHELELARQTLEQKVEERTYELKQALKKWKETQSQLIQNEKMTSLGQMVAGIAHEINNPINFIHGNIDCASEHINDILDLISLYQQEYPELSSVIAEKTADVELEFITQDLVSIFDSMKMGTQRIRDIVLSLRKFSRLDESEMKEVDIHEGINSTLLILNHRLTKDIHIIKNYNNLPLVECYPAQLNQVFMNIISNAIDALIDYNCITNKQIIITTSMVNEHDIQVSIRDNGPGIPLEIQNKLFDPFFTTKPIGKGTGLGLSISYQIIEKHQGSIDIVSTLQRGTEFIISLPIKTKTHRQTGVKDASTTKYLQV